LLSLPLLNTALKFEHKNKQCGNHNRSLDEGGAKIVRKYFSSEFLVQAQNLDGNESAETNEKDDMQILSS
jgi:hypothetical protein